MYIYVHAYIRTYGKKNKSINLSGPFRRIESVDLFGERHFLWWTEMVSCRFCEILSHTERRAKFNKTFLHFRNPPRGGFEFILEHN